MTAARDLLIDISRPVDAQTPVWPGDAPCCERWTMRRDAGATVNVAELRMSAHTGTHADGPLHVLDRGDAIGAVPLSAYIGPALVLDVRNRPTIDADLVREALDAHRPERVLFRTGAWTDPHIFPEQFAAPSAEAAALLSALKLVGTDAPSIDPFDSKALPAHLALFSGGAAVVENLLLDDVEPGMYEMIAFPLRLNYADASPVRAVLRSL